MAQKPNVYFILGTAHSLLRLTRRPPIFHEGSKGYTCCKRRVLEFDEYSPKSSGFDSLDS